MRLTHYMPVLPSYRSQSIDLLCKSIDWFLYEGNTGTYWVNILIWTKKCLLNRLFYNMIHWSVWNDELILLFDKPIFLLLEGTRCFFSFITESFSLNSSGYFYFFNKIQYVRQFAEKNWWYTYFIIKNNITFRMYIFWRDKLFNNSNNAISTWCIN